MNIFKNGTKLLKTEDIAITKIKHFLLRQLSRIGAVQTAGFCMSGSKVIL